MAYYGIDYLRQKLAAKSARVKERYEYYDMKTRVAAISSVIPENFEHLMSVLGWCQKSVDVLADRLVFDGFGNDDFYLNELFDMNNRDIFSGSAIKDGLIGSCSFVYISADETGYPRLQAIDGGEATGILDPITYLLTEGFAVLSRDERTDLPVTEAYFTAGNTTIYRYGKPETVIPNSTGHPLLVPMIFKPSAKRPFGHSRITRSNMAVMRSAVRTLWRSEISAEFYSFPQKYITNLDPASYDAFDKWKATIASFLYFEKGDEGDHPILGQFQQQSMTPYADQLKMFASVFAGENGLTLDDLGFTTANPTTAEAIKAAHENLRLTAQAAQRSFGTGFINTAYLAACLRDKRKYARKVFSNLRPEWQPIFTVEPSELGTLGDAVLKIQQAFPDYFTEEKLHRLTGL